MPAGGSSALRRGSHCGDKGVRGDPAPFYLPRASCHPTSTLYYPIIASNWGPRFPGDRGGSPHTPVSLTAGSSLTQHHSQQILSSPLGHAGMWWPTDLTLFPQHQPGVPITLALPQLPLLTSLSPSCPHPLTLTMECWRPLVSAPSRSLCLHCTQQLSQDLCQDHCPRCCTCRSPGAAAWGARGAAACKAVGRSCRSPWRAWWSWGKTLRGLCQDGSAGGAGAIPRGVTHGTFEGRLGAQGRPGCGVTQPRAAAGGPGRCLGFPG